MITNKNKLKRNDNNNKIYNNKAIIIFNKTSIKKPMFLHKKIFLF